MKSLHNKVEQHVTQIIEKIIGKGLQGIVFLTEFNGKKLLNGSAAGGITFHIGVDNNATDKIAVSISDSLSATA